MFYLYFHPQSGRSVAKKIYQRDYPPTDKVLNNIKKLIKLECVYRVGEKRESKCHVESTGLVNIINEQLKEITDELTDREKLG